MKLSRRRLITMGAGLAVLPDVPARAQTSQARPNIVWIVCHDIHAPLIGCYGNTLAKTLAIDRLAHEGTLYRNAFATTPVCAPSRFALVTGVYPQSCAPAHQMRADAKLPSVLKPLPLHMRAAGYYCTNNVFTDYNMDADPDTLWDECSIKAHWRNRPANTPFFCVYNYLITHESHVFDNAPTQTDPAQVRLPPFLPDRPDVRHVLARNIDMVNQQDVAVAHLLEELEVDGLADDTIVVFTADHGGVHPRSKRYCYDDGLHVPLIVRVPSTWQHLARSRPGQTSDELVSLVDLAPTTLSLAGLPVPDTMMGRAFLGAQTSPKREFAFSMRDRMDERYDLVHTVRDDRYRYIRNFDPHRICGEHESYEWQSKAYQAWEQAHLAGELNDVQSRFWQPKPIEELYDTVTDPHEIVNLIHEPAHRAQIAAMRRALDEHMLSIVDNGFIPEGANEEGYEQSRLAGAYPLKVVMETANLTLARDPNNIPSFVRTLHHPNDIIRFWSAHGLLLAAPLPPHAVATLSTALTQERVDHVRCALAEALIVSGKEDLALKALANILQEDTNERTQLLALNVMTLMRPEQLLAIRDIIQKQSQSKDEYLHRAGEYLLLKVDGRYSPDVRTTAVAVPPPRMSPTKMMGDPQI